jgi:IS30 family transposase
MELRARGWSVRAAAREVGVSRSAGANWSRGYKTYRNGVVVGYVAPLDRLAVREVSSRYLSQDERIEIADLRQSGLSLRAIAVRLGRATSTVSRELRRNAAAGRGYRPFDAHRRATSRRARQHRRRVETNAHLGGVVAELLGQRWSPEQISRHLRHRFPEDRSLWLCPRVSIKLYTNRIRASCGPRGWRLTAAHRCVPVETTAERTSVSSVDGRGSNNRCSPSTTGRSRP